MEGEGAVCGPILKLLYRAKNIVNSSEEVGVGCRSFQRLCRAWYRRVGCLTYLPEISYNLGMHIVLAQNIVG